MHLIQVLVATGLSLSLSLPAVGPGNPAGIGSRDRWAQASCPGPESRAAPGFQQQVITTASGLQYVDLAVGAGPVPEPGQLLALHYTGWLADTCEPFDSSRERGVPFTFPLGQGRVIRGWDEGVATMRVGGERLLIVPPELGYGATGIGPIPPDATLIFAVELLEIR
jgi:peptidylprolyl isomerase